MYLIARYMRIPRDPKQTAKKGYVTSTENVRYNEDVQLAKSIKNRDYTAQIILNLKSKTVEKCNFEGAKDFETLYNYYLEVYPKLKDVELG